jgi:UDP-N-acetylmuramoylalanine--D-glutamate ligase
MGDHPRPPLPAGPQLVVGLARSGVAAALALRAAGQTVIAHDSGTPERAPALGGARARLQEAGVEVHLGGTGEVLVERARSVVKSPGVPPQAPVIAAARAAGRPVIGELELGWRLVDAPFIAVTGTNGKTTTTEWIGHIHRIAALPVAVAGNVGTAVSTLAGTLDPGTIVVCEASSFQLEDTDAFAPEAAVLLNLAPDHLDRHGSYEGYVAAKLRIFAHQGNDDVAVAPLGLGIEDLGGCARRVCIGSGPAAELADESGQLWWDEAPLIATGEIALPGLHNRANAMAAAAVCLARGVDRAAVAEGLRTFAGVAHRLQLIAVHDGVAFVNDSKATNVDSAVVAIRSYAGAVHLIAGGDGKRQDFSPLAASVAEHCRAVYLIGAAAAELEQALDGAEVPVRRCGDLATAVAEAARAARPGDTVLLSPACASYDQFPNFEVRGERFEELVAGL